MIENNECISKKDKEGERWSREFESLSEFERKSKKPWQVEPVEIKPTKIIYKPHCGKCGFPIDTSEHEITYQDVYESPTEVMLARKVSTYIYPNKCAHCGALIDSIEIPLPKKLPDVHIGC